MPLLASEVWCVSSLRDSRKIGVTELGIFELLVLNHFHKNPSVIDNQDLRLTVVINKNACGVSGTSEGMKQYSD